MQRQLYPALLLITIALAAALYLRPTVGEELMALARAQGGRTTGSYGQVGSGGSIGLPAQATVFSGGLPAASSQRYPTAQSAPWPVAGTSEAFAGDVPAASTSLSQGTTATSATRRSIIRSISAPRVAARSAPA